MCKKLIVVLTLVLGLVACNGGSGSSSGSGGNPITPEVNYGSTTQLNFTPPSTLLALNDKDSTAAVLVQNTQEPEVKQIKYSVSATDADNITISNGDECSSIAANKSCVLKLNVPQGSKAGSIKIVATNPNSVKRSAVAINQPVIGVEQVMYNDTVSGANGIQFYYYPKLLSDAQELVLNGVVISANAFKFNSVDIVNQQGKSFNLSQMVLSNNLGAGKPLLAKGDSFQIQVTLPTYSGDVNQKFFLKLSNIDKDGNVLGSVITAYSQEFDIISNGGILTPLTTAVYLNQQTPTQSITLINNGNQEITNLSVSNFDTHNITVTVDKDTLAAGQTGVIKLTQNNFSVQPYYTTLTLSYHDGQQYRTQTLIVYANLNPGSPVNPGPQASDAQLVRFTPDNGNFHATTATPATKIVTLQNIGGYIQNNFKFSGLPSGFALSPNAGDSNSCMVTGDQVTKPLGVGESCNAVLSYTSMTAVPESDATLTITHEYTDSGQTYTGQSFAFPINYRVTQAVANLVTDKSDYLFASNGHTTDKKSIIISNLGDGSATGIIYSLVSDKYDDGKSDAFLYGSKTTITCGEIIAAGSSCSYPITFSVYIGGGYRTPFNGTFSYEYLPYSGAAKLSASVALLGEVIFPR